jgi:hypothetical protein
MERLCAVYSWVFWIADEHYRRDDSDSIVFGWVCIDADTTRRQQEVFSPVLFELGPFGRRKPPVFQAARNNVVSSSRKRRIAASLINKDCVKSLAFEYLF